MVEIAVIESEHQNVLEERLARNMPKAEKTVRNLILRELTIAFKATDFFTRNKLAIERERKRLKTVQEVMKA